MAEPIVLAGVDLAWQSEKNPSAIAFGTLAGRVLTVDSVEPSVYGVDKLVQKLASFPGLTGIAIDAPLIINNGSGQRECEKEIGKTYGSRKASCHTSNLKLYPNANSVAVSDKLIGLGFGHLGSDQWQIECYPHPALIEIFGLPERLKYKKGKVSEKKQGQVDLASLIGRLSNSEVIKLAIGGNRRSFIDCAHIESLSGQALKHNEDALDAIICLYIAALYADRVHGTTFGARDSGYIWTPRILCV